ncbi:cupin domain-containing protein [Parahaliea aestuarii]|uniref:Cupin domain-containing protein n=1 Tax=Parahaliea aestuarii TaxID=1852021 RepID=A0A5C8ZMB0_9GAMM|nr:cupin domain-containing protein [Parahaliea aestuarii]TXS89613.1 cupin domain-containing protein [Parahaliea aestuarii]
MSQVSPDQKKAVDGIRIFRAAEATPLTEEQMPMQGMDEGVIAGFTKVVEAGGAEGGGEKVLCLYRDEKPGGFSLCYAWFKSGFVLPRHSHNADCLYYVLGGEIHLGKKVLGKGDGFFVPSDAPYSYQTGENGAEVLEFRNAPFFHILFTNNSEAHWDKVANAFRERGELWKSELVPPTER